MPENLDVGRGTEAAAGGGRAAGGGAAPGVLDASPGSPLVSITNLAAALPSEAASRLEKWELQSVSRFLLSQERIRFCSLSRIPGKKGVDVYHSLSHSSAHYGGLMTCGSVWHCPVCAARVAERRRELLTRALAVAGEMGGAPLLVSYTFSHRRTDTLSASLSGFLDAQRAMTGNRPYKRLTAAYGIVGTVKALEVTWGRANGWHPHAHVIMFAPAEIDPAALEEELYRAWAPAAHRQGLTMTRERGVKVQSTFGKVAEYVAKWGHAPARRLWGAEDEMTKSHSKRAHRDDVAGSGFSPFDLLRWLNDTGERQAAALFRDYAMTFKGRQQLTWSNGLAALLGVAADAEKSDEEVSGEVREDAVLLATLTPVQWRAVRHTNQRGQLLEVARSGDAAALGVFVRRLVAELDDRDRLQLERDADARFAAGWGVGPVPGRVTM
jgi:hypothetical protein